MASNLIASNKINQKSLICEHCDKKLSSKQALTVHMRRHTGEKPYACQHCDKKLSSGQALTVHMRRHTGEKPYSCQHCDKKFSQRISLVSHVMTHMGVKPYCCQYCDKRFSQKSNLTVHLQTHTCEKPYCCKHCDMKFSKRISLVIHLRIPTRMRNLIAASIGIKGFHTQETWLVIQKYIQERSLSVVSNVRKHLQPLAVYVSTWPCTNHKFIHAWSVADHSIAN